MNSESEPTNGSDPDVTIDAIATVGDRVERSLAKIHDGTSVGAVFSAPTTVGDTVVFTAAAVQRMGGFCFGAGGGADDDDAGTCGGGGGGGGGNSEGRPVAVITVGPNGVEVKPVLDLTRIGVTALAALLAVWKFARKR